MRSVGGAETKRHILVDGGNLAHRAYFGYVESDARAGKSPKTAKGLPVGVTYGAISLLGDWLGEMTPPATISVFFDGVSKFRKTLYPEYKSSRVGGPQQVRLVTQDGGPTLPMRDGYVASSDVGALAHVLSLLGCDVYHDPDEECDDLISTFCIANPDTVRVIVSDDKDFFQLLSDPRVVVFRPSSQRGSRFLDAEASTRSWASKSGGRHPAIPPTHVRMFKSLCGDPSDDIPGVRLLRKRVAAGVCHLPTVDDVLASGFPGFSGSERQNTMDQAAAIRRNFELVGMKTDANLSTAKFGPDQDLDLAKEILSIDLGLNVDVLPFSRVRRLPTKTGPIGPPAWFDI